ncbi:hypothetical protein CHGG_02086 [Chaetomium globosum CBS 148.51]|uniref:Uncharacterized protein n=1 Tax=Chaetomium globosum (strain ATCC 6205 / CBS 148.51 / DSM 1962 / NBRC 6347 / NRRL 1970) TaxID=306901 RepID=Q2HCG8_CHAGB|nr:uncharacterized protein CHGG_02086 [Chaetomium globosum CBS 148.51]EAQ93851.1 hypothetical protein CHGG_02086 [Chaetomium globosum CBS 148.51]
MATTGNHVTINGNGTTSFITKILAPVSSPVPVPVSTPVPVPVPAPVSTPVMTPASTPVSAAVPVPVSTPVPVPLSAPVPAPVLTPVMTPASTPVLTPVRAPVSTPVRAPVSTPALTPASTPMSTPVPGPVSTLASAMVSAFVSAVVSRPVPTPALTPTSTPVSNPVPTPVSTPVSVPASTLVSTPASTPPSSPHPTPRPIPSLDINANNTTTGTPDEPSEQTHYRVYLTTAFERDLLHHFIWVETKPNDISVNWGHAYRVDGNHHGMKHQFHICCDPFVDTSGRTKQHISWVRRQDNERVKEVCRSVAPPGPQPESNGLGRSDLRVPARNWKHWTADVIATLRTTGVLQPLTLRR